MDRNATQVLKNLFVTKVTNELMAYSHRALMETRPGPGQIGFHKITWKVLALDWSWSNLRTLSLSRSPLPSKGDMF